MVNLCSKIMILYFLGISKNLLGENLNHAYKMWPDNNMIILLIILFVLTISILSLILYYQRIKTEKTLGLFLNLENMWNTSSLLESRKKIPEKITEELIMSTKEQDRLQLFYAKNIMDFFNHIGLQVYQNIIQVKDIFSLFGKEILEYWEKRNFNVIVNFEKRSHQGVSINPYEGYEYLVKLCKERIPTEFYKNMAGLPSQSFFGPDRIINLNLIIALLVAIISLIIFGFSFLIYKGYL